MRSVRPRITGLVGLLLLLSGCGGAASSTPGSPGSAAPSSSAVEEGAFPVTVAHKFGSTAVEEAPERIVTVGLKEQDDLLALGIVPVGATKWLELGEGGVIGGWATEALGDAPPPEVLDVQNGVQVEKIAALQPDLIIGLYSGLTQEDYDRLSQLAPVVAQPAGDLPDYGIGWEDQARTVGKVVGQPDRMEQTIEDAKSAVASARTQHPEFADKIGLVASTYEGIYVYGSSDPRSQLMTELGFRLPSDIDTVIGQDEFGGNLSLEKTEFLDTDVLLWFAGPADRKTVEARGTYSNLAVHREGRDLFVGPGDTIDAAFSFITVLSLPFLLEHLTPRLAAAVDGDPATSSDEQ